MPKRVGYIYERMSDPEFIKRCIAIGTKESKKKRRKDVQMVLGNVDFYVGEMQRILEQQSFTPAQPHKKTIYDPCSQKYRETSSVPFWPDGLMHIMVVQAMMDIIMRGMSHWSCSSVPGRGTKRVRRRIEKAMRKDPKGTRYAAEIDIKGYYPSIPLDRLLLSYTRKIKDERFLLLVALILTDSHSSLKDALAHRESWQSVTAGKIGLNIGFYICQWSANFYLEPLDHLIETLDGVKYYARYMDNITLLGPNKKKLHRARAAIEAFLQNPLGLQMKGNWQVYRTSFTPKVARQHETLGKRERRLRKPRMVTAVGFRYSQDHTILRKRNFLRLTRQCRKVQKRLETAQPVTYRQAAGLLSRIGQLKHCDSHKITRKYVHPIGVNNLKEVVRHEGKRRQSAQQRIQRGEAAGQAGLRPCPVL